MRKGYKVEVDPELEQLIRDYAEQHRHTIGNAASILLYKAFGLGEHGEELPAGAGTTTTGGAGVPTRPATEPRYMTAAEAAALPADDRGPVIVVHPADDNFNFNADADADADYHDRSSS
jgi:hypothetical protein